MLPGEPDAAVHLDVELRALVAGAQREGGGHGGGVGELVAALLGGAGGVPDRRGGELGRDEHVGAVVLDRLEHGDGPAELHAHLGVGGGLLGALDGDAGRLGRDDERAPGRPGRRRPPGMISAGAPSSVTRAERRVGSRLTGTSTVTPPAATSTTMASSPAGSTRTWARPPPRTAGAVPAARPSRTVMSRRQCDAAEHRPVGQARHAGAPPALGADLVDHGAGDHGGHEGPWRNSAAELFDHDDELREAEARATPRLGQVQAQPPEGGQVAPERREGLGLGVEQGAGGTPRRRAWPGSPRPCARGRGGLR